MIGSPLVWMLLQLPVFVEIPQASRVVPLELRREEQTMGQRPRIVKEGTLSNDGIKPFCRPMEARRGFVLEGAPGGKLCVLRIDFTLHRLDGNKGFQQVTARISLDAPTVKVLDVFPKSLRSEEDMAETLAVSSIGQFLPLTRESPRQGLFSISGLRPAVTGHGESGSGAYWIFEAPGRGPMPIGSRSAFALVSLPQGIDTISGAIQYEADIGMYILGVFEMPGTSKTSSLPFRLPLGKIVRGRS